MLYWRSPHHQNSSASLESQLDFYSAQHQNYTGEFNPETQHALVMHRGWGRWGPDGCLSGPEMPAAACCFDFEEGRLTVSQPTPTAPPPRVI